MVLTPQLAAGDQAAADAQSRTDAPLSRTNWRRNPLLERAEEREQVPEPRADAEPNPRSPKGDEGDWASEAARDRRRPHSPRISAPRSTTPSTADRPARGRASGAARRGPDLSPSWRASAGGDVRGARTTKPTVAELVPHRASRPSGRASCFPTRRQDDRRRADRRARRGRLFRRARWPNSPSGSAAPLERSRARALRASRRWSRPASSPAISRNA